MAKAMLPADLALLDLLRWLDKAGYDFTTVTPATHRQVLARRSIGETVRDALGWSLPVRPTSLPVPVRQQLEAAGCLAPAGELVRSLVRVSRVGGHLFLHSAFPTETVDAVFLGPDTYRFVRFLNERLAPDPTSFTLVDMGAGTGAGAICAAAACPNARLVLVDSNAQALRFAAINATAAGIRVELEDQMPAAFDILVANPPFMLDPDGRSYRDGGQCYGAERALSWVDAAASRLRPGGRILLYTGSAIIGGEDGIRARLAHRFAGPGWSLDYQEVDPDIFGEELAQPAYRRVERLAAIGAEIRRAA